MPCTEGSKLVQYTLCLRGILPVWRQDVKEIFYIIRPKDLESFKGMIFLIFNSID